MMTQQEQDALVCYLMSIKELKHCKAWWVNAAEKACRREWAAAYERIGDPKPATPPSVAEDAK